MAALHDVDEERLAYEKTTAYAWEELASAVRRLVDAIRAAVGR